MYNIFRKSRRAVENVVVNIAIGLILFATLGIIALQLLATAGTTSFQPAVVTITFIVLPILAVLAVALSFYHKVRM